MFDRFTTSVGTTSRVTRGVVGSESVSAGDNANAVTGAFTRVVSGAGGYSLVDGLGQPNGPAGATKYNLSETGNPQIGRLTQSNSNATRYGAISGWLDASQSQGGNGRGAVEANPFGLAFDLRPNRGPGLDPLQGSAVASVVGGVGRDLRYLATGGLAEERSGGERAGSATQAGYSELATSLYLQYCFAAGTPLRTPHGAKAIEDLQVGDLVLSRDEHNANGPVEAKVVEELFVRFGQVMWLTVAGRRIGTTSEHPFWVVGKGWLPAGDLSVGDRLVGIDGQTVCVEAKEPGEYATLYNLRIADWHTDFVGCAEWGWEVWAHNACDVEAQTNIADLETAEQARIDELIAKAAKSKDPGLADTVTILKGYGVQIKDVNHYIGSPPSEVDIGLMNGTIVQVKILSSAAYLTEQLAAIEKATGQVVIGYVIVTQKRGRKSLIRANKLQQTELMA